MVQGQADALLSGVPSLFADDNQLLECLRVVAHLRRLAPFSETKLRQMYVSFTGIPSACRVLYVPG